MQLDIGLNLAALYIDMESYSQLKKGKMKLLLLAIVTDCGNVHSTKEDDFSPFISTVTIIMHVSPCLLHKEL